MKNLNFFSFLLLATLITERTWAQEIPNAGFESWVQQGPFETPEGWDCGPTGTKSQPGHFSSFALLMQSGIFTNPMTGNSDTLAGGGNTGIGGPPGSPHSDGFAFSSRPDSLISWYKYTAAGQDSFRLQVQLTKWSPGIGSRELIAFSEIKASSAADWTRMALSILYLSTENPDTASIRFQSSLSDPQHPHLGSSLTVDDLSFVYNPLSVKKASGYEFGLSIIPNPVSDLLRIPVDYPVLIRIFDAKGRVVIISDYEPGSALQVTELPSGLYSIHLFQKTGEMVYLARFIKQ